MTPTSTGSRTPGAKAHPTFAIPVASVRALSNVAVEGERLSVRRDVLPCQEPLCPSEPRLSGAVFSSIRQPAPVSHGSVKADVPSARVAALLRQTWSPSEPRPPGADALALPAGNARMWILFG